MKRGIVTRKVLKGDGRILEKAKITYAKCHYTRSLVPSSILLYTMGSSGEGRVARGVYIPLVPGLEKRSFDGSLGM